MYRDRCRACDYDIRGIWITDAAGRSGPPLRCPECGIADPAGPEAAPRRLTKLRLLAIGAGLMPLIPCWVICATTGNWMLQGAAFLALGPAGAGLGSLLAGSIMAVGLARLTGGRFRRGQYVATGLIWSAAMFVVLLVVGFLGNVIAAKINPLDAS